MPSLLLSPIARVAACAALCLALWLHGWWTGGNGVKQRWDAERASYEATLAQAQAQAAKASESVRVEYRDRIIKVDSANAALQQRAKAVPADCTVSTAFVQLHNAAAAGVLPDAAP